MKRTFLYLFIGIFGFFSLSSCESVDDAQAVADSFYTAFNNEDQAAMDTLLDKVSVIDAGIKQDFYNVFNQHWEAFGKVNSHDRYSFATSTNNGVATVRLNFTCETEKGSTVYEKLRFIKRDNGYKIIAFEYNVDKAEIDKE